MNRNMSSTDLPTSSSSLSCNNESNDKKDTNSSRNNIALISSYFIETSKDSSNLPNFDTSLNLKASKPIFSSTHGKELKTPAYLKQIDTPLSIFFRTISAQVRRLSSKIGQRIAQRTLRIGVSARIFHTNLEASRVNCKTLQYLEESIAHWVMSRDVLVFMIPSIINQGTLHTSNIRLRDYAKHLDGLLLHGSSTISPQTYMTSEKYQEWPGDRSRDMYEIELLHEFIESGKPVLGICRGCQLINIAFGGSLYLDNTKNIITEEDHISENYNKHYYTIHFPDGSTLSNLFSEQKEAIVNSVHHHQAIRDLGQNLSVEAVSVSDGIIESIRYRHAPFVVGVQWHPEFHRAGSQELLDCTPLLDSFLRAARETRLL